MSVQQQPNSSSTSKTRYAIGIILLLMVVLLWVGSSFLMNWIFSSQTFYKPFFLTYVNTASFSLYFVVLGLNHVFGEKCKPSGDSNVAFSSIDNNQNIETDDISRLLEPATNHQLIYIMNDEDDVRTPSPSIQVGESPVPPIPIPLDDMVDANDELNIEEHEGHKLSLKETMILSLSFCFIWFIANWTTNASLGLTNVASTTILSSMSGPFTLLIGSLFAAEKFTTVKLLAVIASIAGVSLVSYSDVSNTSSPSSIDGDVLALLGAVFYAVYITFLKTRIGDESNVNMPLFFAFVGLFNIVCLLPVMGLVHATGIERFEWPDANVWKSLAVNAVLGTFLSDYLWLRAMLMTTPLVVTLGLSLTIPLALFGDTIIKRITLPLIYYGGAFLIVMGFVGVNLGASDKGKRLEDWVDRQVRKLWRQRSGSGEVVS